MTDPLSWLTDSVENVIDVASDALEMEFDKRKVAKLIADGVTIAAAAEVYGVSVDVIEGLLDD